MHTEWSNKLYKQFDESQHAVLCINRGDKIATANISQYVQKSVVKLAFCNDCYLHSLWSALFLSWLDALTKSLYVVNPPARRRTVSWMETIYMPTEWQSSDSTRRLMAANNRTHCRRKQRDAIWVECNKMRASGRDGRGSASRRFTTLNDWRPI